VHHIGYAVDHDQMTVFVHVTGIARVQPAVTQQLFGFVGQLVVARADRSRFGEDFPVFGNAAFGSRQGHADGVRPDIAVAMHVGDARDLGLTVDLFQVDADGLIEGEELRTQGCAAGIGTPQSLNPIWLMRGSKTITLPSHERKARESGMRRPDMRYAAACWPVFMKKLWILRFSQ
jgi:hypothetical protein